MSEAPARKPDEAASRRRDGAPARRSDEASPRRQNPGQNPGPESGHDPDVALTAGVRPAPRPRAAPRAPRVAVRPGPAGPLARLRLRADRIMRHPAGIVGGLLALGAVAAVAANALSFQTGRHPAPLFAKGPSGKAPQGKAPPDTVSDTGSSLAAADPGFQAGARTDAPRAAKPDSQRAAPPDGIGALIRGDDRTTASVGAKSPPARAAASKPAATREAAPAAHPPAPVREAKVSEKAVEAKATALHAAAPAAGAKPNTAMPDKSIAYAQRALVKLGYGPLTVDGVAGPSTRAALARFERERRLPGTSVARRTLQELEARSGLKPE